MTDADKNHPKRPPKVLPLAFETVGSLAAALGLTETGLVRIIALNTQYRCVQVPKRGGGTRTLCLPPDELKSVQRKLLDLSLGLLPTFRCVHGGRKGRGHVSHAFAHLKAKCALVLDVADAFGSATPERVRQALQEYDLYSAECIEVIIQLTMYCGSLPQGAPTSNALWSAVCRNLDYQLIAFAEEHELVYTRYVDEFVFSSKQPEIRALTCRDIVRIIEHEGFRLRADKTHYQRVCDGELEITGLKIRAPFSRQNRYSGPPIHLAKHTIEALRAFLHRALHDPTITRAEVEGRLGVIRQINNIYYKSDGRPYPYGMPRRLYKLYCLLREQRGWNASNTVSFFADGDSSD